MAEEQTNNTVPLKEVMEKQCYAQGGKLSLFIREDAKEVNITPDDNLSSVDICFENGEEASKLYELLKKAKIYK